MFKVVCKLYLSFSFRCLIFVLFCFSVSTSRWLISETLGFHLSLLVDVQLLLYLRACSSYISCFRSGTCTKTDHFIAKLLFSYTVNLYLKMRAAKGKAASAKESKEVSKAVEDKWDTLWMTTFIGYFHFLNCVSCVLSSWPLVSWLHFPVQ